MIPWGMSARANGKSSRGIFEQEDTFSHAVVGDGNWFGVFDGHGGPHDEIRVCDKLRDNLHGYFEQAAGDVHQRFLTAFGIIEDEAMSNRLKQTNGSTAVAVYIDTKCGKAHVAHVGDSRAVFFSCNGIVDFATRDHVLEREDEMARVKGIYSDSKIFEAKVHMKGNGRNSSRVNGLPMTRSIGDPGSKQASKALLRLQCIQPQSWHGLAAAAGGGP